MAKKKELYFALFAAAICASIALWISNWFLQQKVEVTQSVIPEEVVPPVAEENPPVQAVAAEQSIASYDSAALLSTLEQWQATLPVDSLASVVIADEGGEVLAQINKNEQYFTASIYKLYVAYEGYRKIDDGSLKKNEKLVAGFSVEQCLFKMIKESDSPCGEALLKKLGSSAVTEKMKSYGLNATSLSGLQTTAEDSAVLLGRLLAKKDLSEASTASLLDSMKAQDFRDALVAGFKNSVVYDKVGFRELVEYHDVGIVELAGNRKVVISVFTKKVGTTKIANLASQLELVLTR